MRGAREHFFIGRIKEDQILDTLVTRELSYLPEQIGLEPGRPRVSLREHTIPLEQSTAVLRVAEYVPTRLLQEADLNQPPVTMIVFGGGSSSGPGTNVKLAVGAEDAFLRLQQRSSSVPNIQRILMVSNPGGAPKDKRFIDSNDMSVSAELAKKALAQLRVDERTNTVIMGFSLGGAIAVELAALFEQVREENDIQTATTDLVLIEPAGTVDSPLPKQLALAKLGYHFTAGNFVGAVRRYRNQGFGYAESVKRAKKETQTAWATIDGVPSWPGLIKDALVPHRRHLPYAKAYGLEKTTSFGPNTNVAISNSIADSHQHLKGRVLVLEMENAQVVNHPIQAMFAQNQFPNAAQRNGAVIPQVESHSYAMVDDGQMMDTIAQWLSAVPAVEPFASVKVPAPVLEQVVKI